MISGFLFHLIREEGAEFFSVLSGFAKKAIPFLARTVVPEAIQMGKGVLSDVLEAKRLRDH